MFRASGDAWSIIKNLTTTDKPGYCHWLNPQGRILFEGFVHPIGDDWLIEIDSALSSQFKRHFAMYSLRKKVVLSEESLLSKVLHVTGPEKPLVADEKSALWLEDKRLLRTKSWRVYCNDDRSVAAQLPQRDARYDTLKILSGCPENASVLSSGKNISLECNLEELGGVSFDKGCYLGQELVSRAHFTGVLRKRLLPVVLGERAAPTEIHDQVIKFLETSARDGSKTVAGEELVDEKGKDCGSIFCVGTEFENLALAMVRLQQVEDKTAIKTKQGGVRVWPMMIK